MADPRDTAPSRVLVGDYGGTMTRYDFYQLRLARCFGWFRAPAR